MPTGYPITEDLVNGIRTLKEESKWSNEKIASELHLGLQAVRRALSPEVRERNRRYRRSHQVHIRSTDGSIKSINTHNKRPFPVGETCELCGRRYHRRDKKGRYSSLHYHHWHEDHYELGLWLCPTCHYFAESLDSLSLEEGLLLVRRYFSLKHPPDALP